MNTLDTKFNAHFFVKKGTAAEATDAPQPEGLLCNPVMKTKRNVIVFFYFSK